MNKKLREIIKTQGFGFSDDVANRKEEAPNSILKEAEQTLTTVLCERLKCKVWEPLKIIQNPMQEHDPSHQENPQELLLVRLLEGPNENKVVAVFGFLDGERHCWFYDRDRISGRIERRKEEISALTRLANVLDADVKFQDEDYGWITDKERQKEVAERWKKYWSRRKAEHKEAAEKQGLLLNEV